MTEKSNEARVVVVELPLNPPPPAPPTLQFKKLLVFGFLGLVVGVVACLSYYWFIYSLSHVSTNNAYVEADIWPINSRIMGYVKEVPAEEGQEVKKGDSVVTLDDSDLKIELEYKLARYKKAKADLKRAVALKKSDIVSESDFELAEANLTSTKADLDGTLLKMQFTQLKAPVDGILAKVTVHPNQFIQPGQNIMMLVSKNSLWIKANYKETQLAKVKKGMSVELEVDAFPGVIWRGHVVSIAPSSGATLSLIPPENATGNFTKIVQRIPVKISVEPKSGFELKPGMSVISTIFLK